MKAYKVVRRVGLDLVSATNNSRLINENGICVTYIPNKYVKPVLKGSLLFCFTNYDAAVDFAENRMGFGKEYEVWEAEIKHQTTRGIFAFSWNVKDAWKAVMQLVKNHKKITSAIDKYAYNGSQRTYEDNTIWAAQVKLTKLISSH